MSTTSQFVRRKVARLIHVSDAQFRKGGITQRATVHGVVYRGTRQELIASGIAYPAMFESLAKSWAFKGYTDVGADFTLYKQDGAYLLEIEVCVHAASDGADKIHTKKFRAKEPWLLHGAAVEATVSEALQRMRRPRS
jgi:hypothetical protein